MSMKIYISGKITGYEISEAEQKFKNSEDLLLAKGFDPVNPFALSETSPDKTWKDYMIDDIRGLFDCEAIFMQSDWPQSKGARVEHAIAVELGMPVFYEDAGIPADVINEKRIRL